MPERSPVESSWLIDGATKDQRTVTARWTPASLRLIDGVRVHEVVHVPKNAGFLTEVVRGEWLDNARIDQVFQVVLDAGAISAWHAHEFTTDRIFVSHGMMRIVLYDNRADSPTRGLVNEFRFGTVRPALVVVPPRVWHGLHNTSPGTSIVLNLVDQAYDYENPDHWRIPHGDPRIPVSFV